MATRASPKKMKANIQRLVDERTKLLEQMTALKNKIEGLDLAIQMLVRDDASVQTSAPEAPKRGNAKSLLLDLLKEVGSTGLNATLAVELAARRGIRLERGTAASNLSRMKADGVVTHDNDKYRLPEFSRPPLAVHAGGKGS